MDNIKKKKTKSVHKEIENFKQYKLELYSTPKLPANAPGEAFWVANSTNGQEKLITILSKVFQSIKKLGSDLTYFPRLALLDYKAR